MWELLLSGIPYTVELIKGSDGRCKAHITSTVTAPRLATNPKRGYLGMDTNTDGVALVNVGYTGQPELGRSTFIHDFAPGKKLLTFDAVTAPPQSSPRRNP